MQRLMSSFCLLAVAGMFVISSCQKQAPASPNGDSSGSTTVNSRIGTAGQQVRVALTPAQTVQFRQTGHVRVDAGSVSGLNSPIIGGGGIEILPGNCEPIPASFFTYWQAQANACCCTVIACAQDQTCAYVMFAFLPNCGPGGGGGSELQ